MSASATIIANSTSVPKASMWPWKFQNPMAHMDCRFSMRRPFASSACLAPDARVEVALSLSLSTSSLHFSGERSSGRGPAPRRPLPHLDGGRSFGVNNGRVCRQRGASGRGRPLEPTQPCTLARLPASSPRPLWQCPWSLNGHSPPLLSPWCPFLASNKDCHH